MNMYKLNLVAALVGLALVACGGPKKGPKSGAKDAENDIGGVVSDECKDPSNPKCKATVGAGQEEEIKKLREPVSDQAKKDFEAAIAFYEEKKKAGWTDDVCSAVADRFADVAGSHDKMIEARFNAGMAWHRCGKLDKAKGNYEQALKILPNHAPTLSNLGEIEFRNGNVQKAADMWKRALALDSKLIGARNNLAWLLLVELKQTKERSAWNRIEKEAREHLSSVLAVDQENVPAYVLYGLVYMEGSERNSNRLDLAKLLLDEAGKRNPNYPALHNARGLLFMRRKSPGFALERFMEAVKLDPEFLEARMNVGNITLGFRKYDVAAEQFSYVLGKRGKDYDAHIGLGIAQRGLGKLDDAEKEYNRAREIDPRRGESYFNLGVLYQGFRANKAGELKASQEMYRKAKGYFQDALSRNLAGDDRAEAQELIKDCDKVIKQIDDAIRAQASAPSDK